MFYFRLVFASLITRHWLRVREKPAILKLTAILQYFANVVGERVNTVRFANLTASDYRPGSLILVLALFILWGAILSRSPAYPLLGKVPAGFGPAGRA